MVYKPQILVLCANPKELTWSVILKDGTDHCNIKDLQCSVPIQSHINSKANNTVLPRMWFECFGCLSLEGNIARITE